MDQWTEYRLFVLIIELGSMSKAAEALGLSNASASRSLASLEKRLGARLIERNTRRSYVNAIGQNFYDRCKTGLSDMQEAEEAVKAARAELAGVLRVTASLSLALQHITPLLPRFIERYPNVRVELVAANRYHDIIDNNIDVAIRTREFERDSSVIIRPLAKTQRVLAASPAYLERMGIPRDPHELASHQLLLYTYHEPDKLKFQRGKEVVTIETKAVLESNDGQILRSAALNGLGLLVQPVYVIYDDLAAGRLIPLLTDWELPRLSISLVYQNRQYVPARTRAFIDFLIEDFQVQAYDRRWSEIISGAAADRLPLRPASSPGTK